MTDATVEPRPVEDLGARTVDDTTHPTNAAKNANLQWVFDRASLRQIEEWADAGARHNSTRDGNPVDGLASILYVLRHFAFATRDYSTGEAEKLVAIVIKRLVKMTRRAEAHQTLINEQLREIDELEAEIEQLRYDIETSQNEDDR